MESKSGKHSKRNTKNSNKPEDSFWGPKQDKTKAIFAIVRHGERADNVAWKNIKYDIPFDPPITDEGIAQAIHTGKYFKTLLNEQGPFTQVKVESSPFLRSLMTASYIAKQLGLPNVRINYAFSEKLNPYHFDQNPIDQLLIKVTPPENKKKVIVDKYLGGMDYVDTDIYYNKIKRTFPENGRGGYSRTQNFSGHLIKKYQHQSMQHEKVLHIAVSHGAFVSNFGHLHGGSRDTSHYCSISAIQIEKNKVRLMHDSSNIHFNQVFEDQEENEIIQKDLDHDAVMDEKRINKI
eukprot:403346213